MPWEPGTMEQQRREFVMLAQQEKVPFRELCRRFGISPRIGYKRCHRFAEAGAAGLQDRSCRPHRTRPQLPAPTQQAIVALRQAHPCWGARKLRRLLQNQGLHPAASHQLHHRDPASARAGRSGLACGSAALGAL